VRTRIIVLLSSLSILLLMSSCGLFSGQQEINAEDAISTSVAETLAVMNAAETIAAQTLAVPAETEETVITEEEATPLPPTETPTDLPTATLAFTATSAVPMAQVSVNTNCRTGPGIIYDLVSALLVGQEAEVVARNADGTYWVIKNPGGSGTCWLWGFYATVAGPTASLPVWDAPPTPTPLPTSTFTPTPTNTPTPLPTIPPLTRTLRLASPYMTGDDVLLLQQRLLSLGYTEVGTADGIFGPNTDEAVRIFQTRNGLAADGIVGQTTWNTIFSSTAIRR
jgi:uncharacterized protein YraI